MNLKIRFVATSPEDLSKGLMWSPPLDLNECALFVFKTPSEYSFWNKNVNFPISLLFLNDSFQIKDIGELESHQEKPCRSKYPLTKYVVEGHKDLITENDIQIGDYCLPEKNKLKLIKGNKKKI